MIGASVNPIGSRVVCDEWDMWIKYAQGIALHMPDGNWDWCHFATRSESDSAYEIIGLTAEGGELLGFMRYQVPVNDIGYRPKYASVHPMARFANPGRTIKGVGTALLAYICQRSLSEYPEDEIVLGAVLPEAEDFYEGLGATCTGYDGECYLYKLPKADVEKVVARYET